MKKCLILMMLGMLVFTGCSAKEEAEGPTTPEVNEDANTEGDVEADVETEAGNLLEVVNGVLEGYEKPEFQAADEMLLTDFYQFDAEMIEDFALLKPMMNTQATEVIVVTATEGNLEAVKGQVDSYMDLQEQNWSTYLPEQYDLVKARVTAEVNNTYIVVVSDFAADIVADLTAALQ